MARRLGWAVIYLDVAFFSLFDLTIALGLLAYFVAAIVVFLVPRLTGARRAVRLWFLVSALAGVGLFVVFNVAYFNGFGTDPVINSPTPAQVTGSWIGPSGARLVLRAGGSFTASDLPPYVGQPTDFPEMLSARNPPSGDGTWVIGADGACFSAKCVIFTFTNSTQTFVLQAEKASPPGGPALFYYRGDPDDWSDQYAFTRQ